MTNGVTNMSLPGKVKGTLRDGATRVNDIDARLGSVGIHRDGQTVAVDMVDLAALVHRVHRGSVLPLP